jgi:hypothetical protein
MKPMKLARLLTLADDPDVPVLGDWPPTPQWRPPPRPRELKESDYWGALDLVRRAGHDLHDAERRHRDLGERYRNMLQAANEKLKTAQDLVRSAEDRALRAEARQREAEERAARAEARAGEAEEGAKSDREGLVLIRKAFERFKAAHASLRSGAADIE